MVDDFQLRVVTLIEERGRVTSSDVAKILGISRQAAHGRLKAMVDRGEIVREGAARATRYRLAAETWKEVFPLRGLAEDRVFQRLSDEVAAVGSLDGEVLSTVSYIVTELVNNAIDHSSGSNVSLSARVVRHRLTLEIHDDGVGAFAHVRDALGLPDELAALQQISKGKTTTAPEDHTGEGLFFSSKAAQHFRLESGSLAWVVDNERSDMAVESLVPPRLGTLARAEIDTKGTRSLRSIFEEFTENHEFSKTRTVVKLFAIGVRFISRSEAKRLLHGLEQFREVVLDFAGVTGVGQGFADQVFRVWAKTHPETLLVPKNMTEGVAFMVERARSRA